MKIIKEFAEQIEDELEGAAEYAELAAEYKGVDDSISSMYAEMAEQELKHVDRLHGKAVEIIKKHRQENGEPPEAMQAVWDWEHKKMINKAAGVRAAIDMARK